MLVSNENLFKILDILEETYPDKKCALDHKNAFELLIAVSLSAQTTDISVNKVTPSLFSKYPTAFDLASAKHCDVEEIIKSIGLYKNKTKNIINLSNMIVNEFNGVVPNNFDELVKLPGVGRKTANVVLSVWFKEQHIAVDTHVFRVSNRIGLTNEENVLDTEYKLMERIPKERWIDTHHLLIFHGRNICLARNPKCDDCPINIYCEYLK